MEFSSHSPLNPVHMDIKEIMLYLPHRPPMLMLDKVLGYNDLEIQAEKTVNADAHYFQGHFQNKPIMPGVMIVEAIAQAGALIAALNGHFNQKESIIAFTGIDKAKFKKTVYPNETLCVYARIVKQRSLLYKFEGHAIVNSNLVARVGFSAMKVPK